jgi:hypothetical protein
MEVVVKSVKNFSGDDVSSYITLSNACASMAFWDTSSDIRGVMTKGTKAAGLIKTFYILPWYIYFTQN